MRPSLTLGTAAVILVVTGCGVHQPSTPTSSGVTGLVHLGPTCPVERPGEDCRDRPAVGVSVRVARVTAGSPGATVASGTTGNDGRFSIDVAPGTYVVTATAGLSCQNVEVKVETAQYAELDVPCDTGIR